MKLVIIRHAEPDYVHDSLTLKGFKEAEILAQRITKLDVRDFYCSPLGRAQKTAKPTLKKLNRTAKTLDWLREFPAEVYNPDYPNKKIAWDFLPCRWTAEEDLYSKDKWLQNKTMKDGNVEFFYKKVANGLDDLLSKYGYIRNGNYYSTEKGNTDTIVMFCHLGVQFVMLSHLLAIAAPLLWQGFFVAPSSVTVVCSEERKKGDVYFRCKKVGDTSHLYAAGEPVSNIGFFEEIYNDKSNK